MMICGIVFIIYYFPTLHVDELPDTKLFSIITEFNDCFMFTAFFTFIFIIYASITLIWTLVILISKKRSTIKYPIICWLFILFTILSVPVGGFALGRVAKTAYNCSLERGDKIANALEKYKQNNGVYPKTLKELVPDYISKIPTTGIVHNDFGYVNTHPFSESKDYFSLSRQVHWHGIGEGSTYLIYFPKMKEKKYFDKSIPMKRINNNWVEAESAYAPTSFNKP